MDIGAVEAGVGVVTIRNKEMNVVADITSHAEIRYRQVSYSSPMAFSTFLRGKADGNGWRNVLYKSPSDTVWRSLQTIRALYCQQHHPMTVDDTLVTQGRIHQSTSSSPLFTIYYGIFPQIKSDDGRETVKKRKRSE